MTIFSSLKVKFQTVAKLETAFCYKTFLLTPSTCDVGHLDVVVWPREIWMKPFGHKDIWTSENNLLNHSAQYIKIQT